MATRDGLMAGDAAGLLRAYLLDDVAAFSLLSEDKDLVLFALGMAMNLAEQAAGGRDALDAVLQRVVDHHRGPGLD